MRTGCDIVMISALEEKLARPKFISFVFHPDEVAYCEGRAGKAASYAVRFAAKEAFAKALGTGFFNEAFGPKDVWVGAGDANGRPSLVLSDRARELLAERGLKGVDVSLSHAGEYALATVVLF